MPDIDLWTPIARSRWDAPLPDALLANGEMAARAYHNPHHIREMLGFISIFELSDEDAAVARDVAFYHDFIYEAARSDNEERSAIKSLEFGCGDRVAALIRATKTHEPTTDQLSAIVLDADLFILAAPGARYATYVRGIREEYAHLTDAEFRAGRLAFLDGVLQRVQEVDGHIFSSTLINVVFEPAAARNILAEVHSLQEQAKARD